jgi:hypothetical protein
MSNRKIAENCDHNSDPGLVMAIFLQLQIALTWGRCYDHNFLRFLPIFGEKIGVFLKNQCYDQNFG